jgi:hypothetical protein
MALPINRFWDYFQKALGKRLFADPGTAEAREEQTEKLMRNLLQDYKIGMRDIYHIYRRKPGKARSAGDNDFDPEFTETLYSDLRSVVRDQRMMSKIVFTSKRAAELAFKHGLTSPSSQENEEFFRLSRGSRLWYARLPGQVGRFALRRHTSLVGRIVPMPAYDPFSLSRNLRRLRFR